MATKKRFNDTDLDLHFSLNDAPKAEKEGISADTPADAAPQKREAATKYADILDSIKTIGELHGTSMSFYLDNETRDAVLSASKEMNVSRSKLVNQILKQILLGGKDK